MEEQKKEYTDLEKKVINKGLNDFSKELKEASKPMIAVLMKYAVYKDSELLKKITLRLPYDGSSYEQYAVNIPDYATLTPLLATKILEMFINNVKELKNKVDNLPI